MKFEPLELPVEEQVFEFVHPDLSDSNVVAVNVASDDFVGRKRPEDVSDPRTRRYFDPTAAHPRLEAQLEIFASPDFQT